MDMTDLFNDDLRHEQEDAGERLSISPAYKLEDIFALCSTTNSQVTSLIQLTKTMSTRLTKLEEEVQQLKATTNKTQAVVGSVVSSEDTDQTVEPTKEPCTGFIV